MAAPSEEILQKCDQLDEEKKFFELFDYLKEQNQAFPDNNEITWRMSRIYYDLSTEEPTKRQEHLNEALAFAEKALKNDPENYILSFPRVLYLNSLFPSILYWALMNTYTYPTNGMLWCSALFPISEAPRKKSKSPWKSKNIALRPWSYTAIVCLSLLSLYPTIQCEIRADFFFFFYVDGDQTLNHLYGRWCYAVAGISWLERKLAATFFATPPESSYEEALKYFVQGKWRFPLVSECACGVEGAEMSGTAIRPATAT